MDIIFWKWWTIFISGIIVCVILYLFGAVPFLISQDVTYISFLIIMIGLLMSSLLSFYRYRNKNVFWFASDAVISLGMIGTIIGFYIVLSTALGNINPDDVESIKAVISSISIGMGSALLTTLTGLIVSLWLKWQLVTFEVREL